MGNFWQWITALGAGVAAAALNAAIEFISLAQTPDTGEGLILGGVLMLIVRILNAVVGKLGGAGDGTSPTTFRRG